MFVTGKQIFEEQKNLDTNQIEVHHLNFKLLITDGTEIVLVYGSQVREERRRDQDIDEFKLAKERRQV